MEQVSQDAPTKEWCDKHEHQVEDRDVKNRGIRGYRNTARDNLERYAKRGELSKHEDENKRLYEAGECLRKDYENSGIETIARIRFDRASSSPCHESPSERREFARTRFNDACKSLGPLRDIVVACVCNNQPVGVGGLPLLKCGLNELARFYRV
jgi:hypothetical protein